jgi:hypothetical protein
MPSQANMSEGQSRGNAIARRRASVSCQAHSLEGAKLLHARRFVAAKYLL